MKIYMAIIEAIPYFPAIHYIQLNMKWEKVRHNLSPHLMPNHGGSFDMYCSISVPPLMSFIIIPLHMKNEKLQMELSQ